MDDEPDIIAFPGVPEPEVSEPVTNEDMDGIIRKCLETPYLINNDNGTQIDFPVLVRSLTLMSYLLDAVNKGEQLNPHVVENLAIGDLNKPVSEPRVTISGILIEIGESRGADMPPSLLSILLPRWFEKDFWARTYEALLYKDPHDQHTPLDLYQLFEQSRAAIEDRKLAERCREAGLKLYDEGSEAQSTAASGSRSFRDLFWKAIEHLGQFPGISRINSP